MPVPNPLSCSSSYTGSLSSLPPTATELAFLFLPSAPFLHLFLILTYDLHIGTFVEKQKKPNLRSLVLIGSFVSILSFNRWQNVHYIDIDLCTLTSFLSCYCFFLFLQLVHRQTQLSCTTHSLTSVHAHLDRTGLESIVFSETSAVILSSCIHTSLGMVFDGLVFTPWTTPWSPSGVPKKFLMGCLCVSMFPSFVTKRASSCHSHRDVPSMWHASRYNNTQHHNHTHDADILALKYAPVAAVVSPARSPCSHRARSFACDATDSLGSTDTPCSNVFAYRSANKQRPCLDSDSGSDFDLLSCHSWHHLSLSCISCLSCLLCQSCPPPCSYVISRARFMASCPTHSEHRLQVRLSWCPH